jgi:hypothetical protein
VREPSHYCSQLSHSRFPWAYTQLLDKTVVRTSIPAIWWSAEAFTTTTPPTSGWECRRRRLRPGQRLRHRGSDGTATIYAITSTISGNGDQGADPNKLVAITDTLSATSLPAESFVTLKSAGYGEVLRGVSWTPGNAKH